MYHSQETNIKHGAETSDEDQKWWDKQMWATRIPPRARVFIWRALRDFIPTSANLKEHHVPTDGVCPLCSSRWATTEHTLIYCPAVKQYWKHSTFWSILKMGVMVPLREIAGAIRQQQGTDAYEEWCIMIWRMWTFVCSKLTETENGTSPTEESSVSIWETYKKASILNKGHRPLAKMCGERQWRRPRE